MKTLFKWIKTLLILTVLAVVFHNWTLKTVLSFALQLGLGAPVEIEAAHLDLFSGQMTFEGILIKNPNGFPRGILAEIPKIVLDFNPSEIQEGRLHLRQAAVEIAELRIVRVAANRMNLLSLKVFSPSSKSPAPPPINRKEPARFQMDRVSVSLDRVTFTDLSGPSPVQQSFRLGIRNAILENSPSLGDVVEAVVGQSIRSAGLEKVLDEAIRSFGLRNWLPEKNSWRDALEKFKQAL